MIDRKKFFDAVRKKPFGGALSSPAVSNMEAILSEWERRNLTDLRWLAYMLATVLAECGRNMAPIPEIGKGRGRKYGNPVNGKVYYGRGYVQLTWDFNYRAMGQLLGVDLLGNPDLALHPDIASKILFEGMIRGSFTGKKLADYFTKTKTDWVSARRIINGTDRASEIAGYGQSFHSALTGAAGATAASVKAKATTPASKGAVATVTAAAGAAGATASTGRGWGTIILVFVAILVAGSVIYLISRPKEEAMPT